MTETQEDRDPDIVVFTTDESPMKDVADWIGAVTVMFPPVALVSV